MSDLKISQLTLATPEETDVIPFVDISDTTMGAGGTTKKATKADLKGEQGDPGTPGTPGADGADGDNAYVYIAYASADDGTDFTMTFNSVLDYIAILSTDTEIAVPEASDFAGLWKNYKGATGADGLDGACVESVAFVGNDMVFTLDNASTVTLTDAKITLKGEQGDPGTDGDDGTDGISFIWEDAYDGGTTYQANDVVSYNGSTYICILESTGNLPTNATYWSLMAQKGADGAGSGDMLASVYDPTSVEGDAFDMDNMAQGDTNKFLSAAQLTVVQNTSGTNTGDQTLPTRDSLGLDTDDSPQFAGINLGHASDTTLSRPGAGRMQIEGKEVATLDNTMTFTNKRVTPRVTSETSSATPTINTDNSDIHRITALAVDVTSMTTNLSGTPTHGQSLIIEITGTAARAITWGASFEASTVALPTTTVTTAMLSVGFKYNSATSKWRCLASA